MAHEIIGRHCLARSPRCCMTRLPTHDTVIRSLLDAGYLGNLPDNEGSNGTLGGYLARLPAESGPLGVRHAKDAAAATLCFSTCSHVAS